MSPSSIEGPDPKQNRAPLRTPEVYEGLLNPEHILPTVTLEITAEEDVGEGSEKQKFMYFDVLTPNRTEPVITLSVVILVPENEAYIYDIGLTDMSDKGEKYGKATYLALLTYLVQHNIRFRSGISLSKPAWHIWEWMRKQGAARLVNDRGVREDNEDFYSYSDYEII